MEPTPQHPDQHPGQPSAQTATPEGVPTWEEIVDRHSERVYRLAMRLTGNRHDAEDLTQEVFVRVFRSLSTYTPGTFEGWIHRITTNLFLDQARRKQRIRFDALSDERADRLHSDASRPRLGLRRPDLRRRHRACSGHSAAGVQGRGRPVRRRGPVLRGDRADPRRQARHRPLPDPPWPRDAARGARPPGAGAGRTRYQGPKSLPGIPGLHAGVHVVIGHLGPRVSALLDGQLSVAEEEKAWEHVHSCYECRDAVEREGWVKTRLATMQFEGSSVPSHLKGSLLVRGLVADWPPLADDPSLAARGRRHLGLAGISSGAVGAAVMGVLALGASPANAPGAITRPPPSPSATPCQRHHRGDRPRLPPRPAAHGRPSERSRAPSYTRAVGPVGPPPVRRWHRP